MIEFGVKWLLDADEAVQIIHARHNSSCCLCIL